MHLLFWGPSSWVLRVIADSAADTRRDRCHAIPSGRSVPKRPQRRALKQKFANNKYKKSAPKAETQLQPRALSAKSIVISQSRAKIERSTSQSVMGARRIHPHRLRWHSPTDESSWTDCNRPRDQTRSFRMQRPKWVENAKEPTIRTGDFALVIKM